MAEIQSALPESFLQAAGAQKSGKKGAAAGLQLASFFGVLKSQIAKKADVAGQALDVKGDNVDLKGDNGKNPLLAPVEAKAPLPAAIADKPALAPLAGDPPAQAVEAAFVSVAVVDKVAPKMEASAPKAAKAGVSLTQASGDANLADASEEAGLPSAGLARLAASTAEANAKSLGAAKPDVLRKAGAAAIAADAGQALPLASAVQQAAVSVSADAKVDAALELAAAPALSPLTGSPLGVRAEAVTSTAAPISSAHPFEQALRQAEAKVNVAIEAPVKSAAFAAELSDKVVWLVGRQGQFADLSLNPPQMGALEVRLTLSGGDASAQFFSPNPLVREAVDAALPKLRELMAQAGINLGEAEVRDQAFGRRENTDLPRHGAAQNADVTVNQAALAGMGMVKSSGLGLVDLYI